jgi:hypothetical protein
MGELEMAAVVAGLVAALRAKLPALDGWWVYLVVIAVAGLVVLSACESLADPKMVALKALRVALQAITAVSVGNYFVAKAKP